jgi:hypothetical protein
MFGRAQVIWMEPTSCWSCLRKLSMPAGLNTFVDPVRLRNVTRASEERIMKWDEDDVRALRPRGVVVVPAGVAGAGNILVVSTAVHTT